MCMIKCSDEFLDIAILDFDTIDRTVTAYVYSLLLKTLRVTCL